MSFSQAQSRGRLLRFLVDNLGQEIETGSPAAGSYIAINSNSELVLTGVTLDGSGPFTEINGSNAYTTSSINIGSTDTPSYTLDVDGTFRAQGYVTLVNGLSSSIGTPISSVSNNTAANYWIKVAECDDSWSSYARGSATIDVMLAGFETTAELYQARVYVSYHATGVATCQVDIIQDAGSVAWDTSDFILTYNSTSDIAQLWVRDPAQFQRCYATITNGSSDGNINYKSDWYLKTGQSWANNYTSLGAVATTTNVKKRFDSLVIDNALTVGDASSDVATINSQLTASEGAYFADRVGIGDATPSYELDVNGTINIADNSYLRIGEIAVAHYTSNQTTLGSDASSQTLALNCGNSSHAPSNTDPAMFIDATGSVGIGAATTPNCVLHIRSEHNPTLKVDPGTNTSVDPSLWLMDTSANAGFKITYDNNVGSTYLDNYYDHANGDIYIRTKVAGTPVNAITIDAAGSVTTAGALYVGTAAQLYTNSTHTMLTNGAGGYIDLKSNHATYGVIIRDYNSDGWANIHTNNGLLQLAYNSNDLNAGIFLNDSDNVGIGDSTPSYKLDVAGTIRATGDLRASGDVRTTDDAVIGDDIWSNGVGSGTGNTAVFHSNKLKYISSTRKIKNDIESVTTSQLDKILALRPVTFELKSDPGPRHMGMVAEEAFEVDPFFAIVGEDFEYDESGQRKRNIYTDENGEVVKERIILSDALVPNDWNTRAVTAALVKAVQELKAENDAHLHRIEQLENA